MKINENTKVILTIGQLKKLVKESNKPISESWDGRYDLYRLRCYFDDVNSPAQNIFVKFDCFGPPDEDILIKALTRHFHKKILEIGYDSDVYEEDSDKWLVWNGTSFKKDSEAKPAKMHAYIRMITDEGPRWYVDSDYIENYETGVIKHREGGSKFFSNDGWDIYFHGSDETRGTAFPDIPSLKQAIKDARSLASWNYGKYKMEIWAYIKGYLKLVKLNADGTFTVIGDYKKNMHAEYDEED